MGNHMLNFDAQTHIRAISDPLGHVMITARRAMHRPNSGARPPPTGRLRIRRQVQRPPQIGKVFLEGAPAGRRRL